jgi:hypothetical protein
MRYVVAHLAVLKFSELCSIEYPVICSAVENSDTMEEVSATVEEQSASAEEVAAQAGNLFGIVETMKKAVATFKV